MTISMSDKLLGLQDKLLLTSGVWFGWSEVRSRTMRLGDTDSLLRHFATLALGHLFCGGIHAIRSTRDRWRGTKEDSRASLQPYKLAKKSSSPFP